MFNLSDFHELSAFLLYPGPAFPSYYRVAQVYFLKLFECCKSLSDLGYFGPIYQQILEFIQINNASWEAA